MKNHSLKGSWIFVRLARVAACGLLGMFGAGCGSAQACSNLACFDEALLTGSVTISQQTTLLDARWCVNGDCRTGQLDLSEQFDTLTWNQVSEADLALAATGTSGAFAVTADYRFLDQNLPSSPPSVELTLSDHQSGTVLLDVTRSLKVAVTEDDDCNVCWGGNATF